MLYNLKWLMKVACCLVQRTMRTMRMTTPAKVKGPMVEFTFEGNKESGLWIGVMGPTHIQVG